MKRFFSNGKLLLTGEYLVLDGANALAVPTRLGQSLHIATNNSNQLKWTSYSHDHRIWFETSFKLQTNGSFIHNDKSNSIAERLLQILTVAKQFNPEFLSNSEGYDIKTELEFPNEWGLGTSSTLINNIANWASIDPYKLLEATFGGSGYDIACATSDQSLVYQINDNQRSISSVNFNPKFKEQLYFVHLNKKQNSRQAIAQYRNNTFDLKHSISIVNRITKDMINCGTIGHFNELINEHEALISSIIAIDPVKKTYFSDFWGSIKSLGAWGGDFILITSEENPTDYFSKKGFKTILSYAEMVKF